MQTTPIPKPSEKQPVKRDQWTGNAQFLLACIGNAVGLGNVWRFPYLAYKNGGGAFVIPYIVMVFIIGLPLFLIELSLGQYSALGPAHLYKELCPLLKGVGMASVVASFVVGIYYNMIIAWTVFYFFESFIGQKWQFCGQYFNTKDCFTILDKASRNLTNTSVSAPEEFFNNYVLEKSKGIEEIGGLNWKLVAVLFISWLIVIASLIKGIQTSGKVVYFTATFPYVILVILFFRGVTLEGAFEGKLSLNLSSVAYIVVVQIVTKGIKFYVIPNWQKVRELQVWRDAAIQVFYSFGIAGGGMLTYASYNRFTENVVKHSLVIGICDMLTSLFAGFVVFSMLGFMAHTLNKSVEEVVQGGIGLAFIAIPDGLSQMPASVFWCVSYFVMLFLLGIDSQFAMIETIITFIFDTLRSSKSKINKPFVVSITGLIMFLCGLSLCTKSGIYILELLDTYSAGFPYLLIALMETIIIAYFYGLSNFFNDLNQMCKWVPSFWLKSHITVLISTVIPVMLSVLLFLDVYSLADTENPLKLGSYTYPNWCRTLGWVIALVPITLIPLGSVHHLIFSKHKNLFERLKHGLKYTPEFKANANSHLKPVNNGFDNATFVEETEMKI